MANAIEIHRAGSDSYFGYGTGYAAYATPTDMLTISGSATKIIRITNALMRIGTTAGALQKLFFVKRTAVNTGGTATQPAASKLDSASVPATAVLNLYSAAPAGLGAGTTISESPVVTTVLTAAPAVFQLISAIPQPGAQTLHTPVTLRGAAESLCLNWAGAALPGGFTATWEILWTESDD